MIHEQVYKVNLFNVCVTAITPGLQSCRTEVDIHYIDQTKKEINKIIEMIK